MTKTHAEHFLDQAEGAGQHTLDETERAVSQRIAALPIDTQAMAIVSDVHRVATAMRGHFERTVFSPHGLTWTGWVVLWVVWVWQEIESRHVAIEAGIAKATLTGVATTLVRRGWLTRRTDPDDGRRVLLSLTDEGVRLAEELFPRFHAEESAVASSLEPEEAATLVVALRKLTLHLEEQRATSGV